MADDLDLDALRAEVQRMLGETAGEAWDVWSAVDVALQRLVDTTTALGWLTDWTLFTAGVGLPGWTGPQMPNELGRMLARLAPSTKDWAAALAAVAPAPPTCSTCGGWGTVPVTVQGRDGFDRCDDCNPVAAAPPTGHVCSSCGATVAACDEHIAQTSRGCCSTCYRTDTHGLSRPVAAAPPTEPDEMAAYAFGRWHVVDRPAAAAPPTEPTKRPRDFVHCFHDDMGEHGMSVWHHPNYHDKGRPAPAAPLTEPTDVDIHCRKCGQPITARFGFGSEETGWEHMAGECPVATALPTEGRSTEPTGRTKVTLADRLAVACPKCSEPAGSPCSTVVGRFAGGAHPERQPPLPPAGPEETT